MTSVESTAETRFEPVSLYCRLGAQRLDNIVLPKVPAQIKWKNLAATIRLFSNDSLNFL